MEVLRTRKEIENLIQLSSAPVIATSHLMYATILNRRQAADYVTTREIPFVGRFGRKGMHGGRAPRAFTCDGDLSSLWQTRKHMCVSVCRKLDPPSADATKARRRDHILFAFSPLWGGLGVDALLMFGKDPSTSKPGSQRIQHIRPTEVRFRSRNTLSR